MLSGLILLIKPAIIFDVLARYCDAPALRVFAIFARTTVGVVLLAAAELSRFPALLSLFGWATVLAAAAIVVMGQERFVGLVGRSLSMSAQAKRLMGLVSLLFGGFILNAVSPLS